MVDLSTSTVHSAYVAQKYELITAHNIVARRVGVGFR